VYTIKAQKSKSSLPMNNTPLNPKPLSVNTSLLKYKMLWHHIGQIKIKHSPHKSCIMPPYTPIKISHISLLALLKTTFNMCILQVQIQHAVP
jgi:hypothetical protein